MAVHIYSDYTQQFYDSIEDATKAEAALAQEQKNKQLAAEQKAAAEKAQKEKEAAERKAAAAKVEEARKAMVAAQTEYRKLLEDFVKKYKSYHYTTTSIQDIPTLFNFISDWL